MLADSASKDSKWPRLLLKRPLRLKNREGNPQYRGTCGRVRVYSGKAKSLGGPPTQADPSAALGILPLIPGKHGWPSPAVGPKANRGTCKEAGTQVTLMLGLRPHAMLRAVSPTAPLSSLPPPSPPSASHMSLHWALCTQNTSYCHTPVTPSSLLSLALPRTGYPLCVPAPHTVRAPRGSYSQLQAPCLSVSEL